MGGAAPQGCPVQASAGVLVCAGGNRSEGRAGCVCGVGDNKILDRDHTQLCPRAPDASGRPVTFEFTAGDVDSDEEGEDDDFTAERILTDKWDPGTPGGRLYKVRWKGFAASRDSWEPPSSFVPRYTTVWMEYLRRKNISLDVKDVLVHLVVAAAP